MKAYGMCIGAELAVVAVLFRCFAALAGAHLNAPVALVQRVMSVAMMVKMTNMSCDTSTEIRSVTRQWNT